MYWTNFNERWGYLENCLTSINKYSCICNRFYTTNYYYYVLSIWRVSHIHSKSVVMKMTCVQPSVLSRLFRLYIVSCWTGLQSWRGPIKVSVDKDWSWAADRSELAEVGESSHVLLQTCHCRIQVVGLAGPSRKVHSSGMYGRKLCSACQSCWV